MRLGARPPHFGPRRGFYGRLAVEQPTRRGGDELSKAEADGLVTVTPAGVIPTPKAIMREGLDVDDETLAKLLDYDAKLWESEIPRRNEYLAQFSNMPKALEDAHARFIEGVTNG